MVKAPRLGTVKTRLARDIGAVRARALYQRMTASLLRRLGTDPRWDCHLAVTPDGDLQGRFWPITLPRLAQGPGDLGERMQRIFDRAPPGPVIIVGTDIPAVQAAHVARAFRLLSRHDAVLGPTPDGGYWLIGLRRIPRILSPFAGVRWSSEHALGDTVSNLGWVRIILADRLADVDTADDLPEVRALLPRPGHSSLPR